MSFGIMEIVVFEDGVRWRLLTSGLLATGANGSMWKLFGDIKPPYIDCRSWVLGQQYGVNGGAGLRQNLGPVRVLSAR